MATRPLTDTVCHWAFQTRHSVSLITLRLKCFAWMSQHAVWALFASCTTTLETLDVVYHGKHAERSVDRDLSYIDAYGPLHLDLRSLNTLITVRLMFHVGLLAEIVSNVVDIQSPVIRRVELHIVLHSDVAGDVASSDSPVATLTSDTDNQDQDEERDEGSGHSDATHSPPLTLADPHLSAIQCLHTLDEFKNSHTLEHLGITFVMQTSDSLRKSDAWGVFHAALGQHLPELVRQRKVSMALTEDSELLESFNDCQNATSLARPPSIFPPLHDDDDSLSRFLPESTDASGVEAKPQDLPRPSFMVSTLLLRQVWSSIGSPSTSPMSSITDGSPGPEVLENRVTHVRIATCTPNLTRVFDVFPATKLAEFYDLYIRRVQTHAIEAPALQGLVVWGCTVDGDALGSLVAGSPELVYLVIGGYGFEVFAWGVNVAGQSRPRPRFGPNLRWALLDISSPEMAYHVQAWAHCTPHAVPFTTLRLRLSVRTIPAIWALWNLCRTSLTELRMLFVDREYIWTRDVFDVMNLELQALSNLRLLYLVFHHAYLSDVMINIRDLSSPSLEHISLSIVVSDDEASLGPLTQLDGMCRVGKFPALRKVHITLVPSVDFNSSRHPGATLNAVRARYEGTVREHCSSLEVRLKLEVSVASYVHETEDYLDPITCQYLRDLPPISRSRVVHFTTSSSSYQRVRAVYLYQEFSLAPSRIDQNTYQNKYHYCRHRDWRLIPLCYTQHSSYAFSPPFVAVQLMLTENCLSRLNPRMTHDHQSTRMNRLQMFNLRRARLRRQHELTIMSAIILRGLLAAASSCVTHRRPAAG
ncbi:hypothetical protein BDZ89DRAFT_1047497 [Hymenopellis radicata]|nr:hypothetical protein BDZ89DRAFT_1047497 [Hymenopellis radicata]